MEELEDKSYIIPEPLETQEYDVVSDMVSTIQAPRDTISNVEFAQFQNSADSAFADLLGSNKPKKKGFQNEGFQLGEAYDRLSDGTLSAKYENFLQGTDNENRLAQEQSTGEQWQNGITKFWLKTGTAIGGGTIGTLYGIGDAITSGDWTAIMDNDFYDVMDDWNKQMDNGLSNYYTKEQREMGFLESAGTANFWANDFLGGLSFTVGAVVSEGIWAAATGGTSLATTAGRLGLRATKLGFGASKLTGKLKAAKGISGKFQRIFAKNSAGYKAATENAVAYGRGAATLNTIRMGYTSAGYEAGIETRMFKAEQEEAFDSYFKDLGREPTAIERSKFTADLDNKANAVFGTNLALVGTSNVLMLGKVYNIGNPLKGVTKAIEKTIFGKGIEKVGEGVTRQAIKRNVGQRIAGTAYNTLKNPVREGVFEEGLQSVTTTAAGSMLESAYNVDKDLLDFTGAVYEGLSHTYGTKEGWKEVGLGMLIGAAGGGGTAMLQQQNPFTNIIDSARKSSKTDEKTAQTYNSLNTEEVVNEILKGGLTETQQKSIINFAKANGLTKAQQRAQQAEVRGDLAGITEANRSGLVSNIMLSDSIDMGMEAQEDLFAQIEGVSNEEIAETRGISIEEAKEVKEKSKEDYISLKKKYDKAKTFSTYMIGNINQKELDKIKKEFGIEKSELSTEGLRTSLAYQMTMTDSLFEDAAGYKDKITELLQDYNYENFENIRGVAGVKLVLDKAQPKARREFYNTNKRLKRAKDNIEKIRKEKEKYLPIIGQDVEVAKKRAIKLQELIKKEQKEQALSQELGTHAKTLLEGIRVATNTPIKKTDEIYIDQDLDKLLDSLDKIDSQIEQISKADPKKGLVLKAYIDAYNKSISRGKRNAEVIEGFMDKDTQLKGSSRKFLTKLVEYNNPTKKILKGLVEEYNGILKSKIEKQEGTLPPENVPPQETEEADIANEVKATSQDISKEEYNDFIDNGKVTQERIKSIAEKIKSGEKLTEQENAIFVDKTSEIEEAIKKTSSNKQLSPKQRIQAKIEEIFEDFKGVILKGKENASQEDILANKPTKGELQEYVEIVEQANVDTDKLLDKNAKKFTNKYLNSINLTREQVERFQELSKKLSDWQLVETFGEEVTVKDLLDQQALAEKEAVKQSTTPLTNEENKTITHKSVNEGLSENAQVENINTQDTVVVRSIKEGDKTRYELSHLKLEDLPQEELERLGIQVIREDDKVIILRPNEEDFVIEVTRGARYKFSEEDFVTFAEIMDMKVIPYKGQVSTWAGVYSKNKEGNYSLTDSNFAEVGGVVTTLTSEELYQLKEGEELFFVVDFEGSFNKEIIEDAISSKPKRNKKERKEIIENVTSILVVTKDGKVVGEVKASTQENHHTEQTLTLRKQAAELMEAEIENYFKGEDSNVPKKTAKLPFKTTITKIHTNQPNIEVDKEGEIIQKEIPENYKVESFGVYKNGEIVLSNNSSKRKNINKSYVQGFTKGIPVLIVKQGSQYIAYPIELEGMSDVFFNRAQAIVNSDLSDTQKMTELMKVALDAGISPEEYNLRHISQEDSSFNDENTMSELMVALKGIKDYISEEDLLENTTKEELKEIATIALNLKDNPFRGAKVKMDPNLVEDPNIVASQKKKVRISKTDILKVSTKMTLVGGKVVVKKGEKLTDFEKRIVSSHSGAMKTLIEKQIKMSVANNKNSKANQNKPCKK